MNQSMSSTSCHILAQLKLKIVLHTGGLAGFCLSFMVAAAQMTPSMAADADGSPTGLGPS